LLFGGGERAARLKAKQEGRRAEVWFIGKATCMGRLLFAEGGAWQYLKRLDVSGSYACGVAD
jgi:hypothetical protein